MDTQIIDQLEAIFGEEFKLVQHDLGKMEYLARQRGHAKAWLVSD